MPRHLILVAAATLLAMGFCAACSAADKAAEKGENKAVADKSAGVDGPPVGSRPPSLNPVQ